MEDIEYYRGPLHPAGLTADEVADRAGHDTSPTDGGLGARNAGRPGLTAEDLRERYAEVDAEVRQMLGSLESGIDAYATSTAADQDDLDRMESIRYHLAQVLNAIEGE